MNNRPGMIEVHNLMLYRISKGGLNLRQLSGILDDILVNDLINHGYINLNKSGVTINQKGKEYLEKLPPRVWKD